MSDRSTKVEADILGTETVEIASSATGTTSNVSASATAVTALSANSSRKKAVFHNDSTSVCYLKCGSSASSTSYTYRMTQQSTVELEMPVYTGIVTAIWDSATGALRVTEFT